MTSATDELNQWLRNGEMAEYNRGPGKTALPIVQNGQAVERPSRRQKYNAQPTEVGGMRFDSKREAQRYQELQLLAAAGEIHALQLQPRFELQPAFKDKDGKKHRAIHYVADFQYTTADGRITIEDTKGMSTAVFRLKYKLFLYRYPDLELRIIK